MSIRYNTELKSEVCERLMSGEKLYLSAAYIEDPTFAIVNPTLYPGHTSRSNLSFRVFASAAKQSLISCLCERSEAISHFVSLRAQRSNLSFRVFASAAKQSLISCLCERSEAISHFVSLRAQRSNLSFRVFANYLYSEIASVALLPRKDTPPKIGLRQHCKVAKDEA
jgi:hypothetical protein